MSTDTVNSQKGEGKEYPVFELWNFKDVLETGKNTHNRKK